MDACRQRFSMMISVDVLSASCGLDVVRSLRSECVRHDSDDYDDSDGDDDNNDER